MRFFCEIYQIFLHSVDFIKWYQRTLMLQCVRYFLQFILINLTLFWTL